MKNPSPIVEKIQSEFCEEADKFLHQSTENGYYTQEKECKKSLSLLFFRELYKILTEENDKDLKGFETDLEKIPDCMKDNDVYSDSYDRDNNDNNKENTFKTKDVVIFKKMKRNFCQAIKKCFNQLKENGLCTSSAFVDSSTFCSSFFNYVHSQLQQFNGRECEKMKAIIMNYNDDEYKYDEGVCLSHEEKEKNSLSIDLTKEEKKENSLSVDLTKEENSLSIDLTKEEKKEENSLSIDLTKEDDVVTIASHNDSDKTEEKIKNQFSVAVESLLNDLKATGYCKQAFEDPNLSNETTEYLFKFIRTKHEEIVERKSHEITLTTVVINDDGDDEKDELKEEQIEENIVVDVDPLAVKIEYPDSPSSNNQLVGSSLTDDDEMQTNNLKNENDNNESSIDEDADSNKDERVEEVEKAVILSDQSDQDEQIEEVDEDNEPTKRRVSGRFKRKINYCDDDDDVDEQSSSNTDNREDDEDYFEDHHGQHFLLEDEEHFEDEDHQSEEDVGDSPPRKRRVSRRLIQKLNYDDDEDEDNDENSSPNKRETKKDSDDTEQPSETLKRKSIQSIDSESPKKMKKSSRRRTKKFNSKKYYSEPAKVARNDKLRCINEWVYKKYLEFKKNDPTSRINSKKWSEWGLQAKEELFPSDPLKFNASNCWLAHFKEFYNLSNKPRATPTSSLSREDKAKIVKLYDEKQRSDPYFTPNQYSQISGYDSKYFVRSKINYFRLQLQRVDTPTNYERINDWVFKEFLKHKQHGDALTDELLIELGQKAKKELNYTNINFCAGKVRWLPNFKEKFNITGKADALQIMD